MKRQVPVLFLILLVGVQAPASAQFAGPIPVIDAASLLKEAAMIQQEVAAVRQQIAIAKEGAAMTKALPATIWSHVQGDVDQLRQIMSQEQNLALTDAQSAQQFDALNPNYSHGVDFGRSYRQWWASTEGAVNTAAATVGTILQQQPSDLSALDAEERQITNAAGQTEVLQAAATISAQEVEQLHKLILLQAIDSHYRQMAQAKRDADAATAQAANNWLTGHR